MAEPPRSDSDRETGEDATIGPPRWVKVFGVIAVVVLVLVVIMLLAGGHNPGRHGGQSPWPWRPASASSR